MCNQKYQAFDGTLFDTQEECQVYTNIPRVYCVVYTRVFSTIMKVYVEYSAAEKYIENQGEDFHHYVIKPMELVMPSNTPKTIHRKITNTPPKLTTTWLDRLEIWFNTKSKG